MANYNSGSVNVTVGSATVKGNGTEFTTYISSGNLFKLTGESVFYEVASVVTATHLTLSARYTDSSTQISVASNVASTTSATNYNFTLSDTPIIQSNFVVTASQRFTDDGAGVLTGSDGGSGTVGYDDGAVTLSLGATSLNATYNIAASYLKGSKKQARPYQIITDFTPNYSLPEAGLNDTGLPTIYTKAVRKIDNQLSATTNNYLETVTATEFTVSGILSSYGRRLRVKQVSGHYAVTATDDILVCNVTASTRIALLSATASNIGHNFKIINACSTQVIASCMGSDTIEGDTTYEINNLYDSMSICIATTNLYVLT